MSCERYRDALTDAAAGEPASPALEPHLAKCASCRSELARLRQLMAGADESLSALASAEPSPGLRARIREAVTESAPAPALHWGFAWPVAAAAGLALAAVGVWRATVAQAPVAPAVAPAMVESARPSPPAAATAGREPTPTPSAARTADAAPPSAMARVRPVTDAARRSATGPARASAAPSRAARAATPEPEVLVPPGQQEALLQFVALVHRECLDVPAFAAAGVPSVDLAEPAAIDIRPLEIAPLDPAEAQGM